MTATLSLPLPPPRLHWGAERLIVLTSLFWALLANAPFLKGAVADRSLASGQTWVFLLALVLMLTCLHYLVLAPFAWGRATKPLLALMIVVTAGASHFMQAYGVYLDPSMLRNVLRTDVSETRELLSWSLLWHLLLYAALPLALLWKVRLRSIGLLRGLLWRLASLGLALALLVGTLVAVYQPFSSLMRNHRELRYLITPGNLLWSGGSVLAEQTRGAAQPRRAVGLDAKPGPRMAARGKPLVVVLVVGETARAANWGLNGYARQTTPQLAALPVLNFPDVRSCGTNTEVSVPCMFAPVGRRAYDESAIRGSESLLHVLARAGVQVHWRDNQSGCKGVCEGLPQDNVADLGIEGLCSDGRCLDEGLLQGLPQRLAQAQGTQLLVLHQLGNHGPSYFRRYPEAFARFQPACRQDDLRLCSQQEIVNAFDNALLYTDHVLARLIGVLNDASPRVDTLMLYVSDHGESLGETNLYLHGLPYPIAPDVQKRVPMVMWLSPGLQRGGNASASPDALDTACLRERAAKPVAHDHLFHTLLGVLDVRTALYEAPWDLAAGCRPHQQLARSD